MTGCQINPRTGRVGIGNFSLASFDAKGIPSVAINLDDNSEWDIVQFTNWELIQISDQEIEQGYKLIDAGYYACSPIAAKIKTI